MDKSWLATDRYSNKYEFGVEMFLSFASKISSNLDRIHRPCRKCEGTYVFWKY